MVNKVALIMGIIVNFAALGLLGYLLWIKTVLDFVYLPGYIIGMISFAVGIGLIILSKWLKFEPAQEENKQEEHNRIFHKSA